jgi:hypothetical protein
LFLVDRDCGQGRYRLQDFARDFEILSAQNGIAFPRGIDGARPGEVTKGPFLASPRQQYSEWGHRRPVPPDLHNSFFLPPTQRSAVQPAITLVDELVQGLPSGEQGSQPRQHALRFVALHLMRR